MQYASYLRRWQGFLSGGGLVSPSMVMSITIQGVIFDWGLLEDSLRI
jgi:hypothetical protein